MNDFSKTEWTKFYLSYKELNQQQLQKKLLHFELEKEKIHRDRLNPYKRMTYIRHLFYGTDVELPKFSKNGNDWFEYTIPFYNYLELITSQLEEVQTYYQEKKMEIDRFDKERRKIRAIEKIECSNCKCMVSRTNMSKHVVTKKCMESI
jgi:hypothetical protein